MKTLNASLLVVVLALTGCRTQQTQKTQDEQFRQRVEQQKHKSNAYPVNGSHTWTHYLP